MRAIRHLSCEPLALSYVLPLRSVQSAADESLTDYLGWLAVHVEVIVVDGSSPNLFDAHHRVWSPTVVHIPVSPAILGANGKVRGMLTGLRAARHDAVIVADDDVRYSCPVLRRMADALGGADLVRPQNYFEPLPWHARWDSARSLLNRAVGHDYPGTLGVRRSFLLQAGGYDAECLFENLELIRTVHAAGGRVASRRSLYVRRLPPSAQQFVRQRVRYAYESFAQPGRLVAELALLPLAVATTVRHGVRPVVGAALALAAVAEVGRRRDGGRAIFPSSCSLLAPAWAAERAVCAWLAVWLRWHRGGITYGDATIRRAGNSRRRLRSNFERARIAADRLATVADAGVEHTR
jgi:hypothetical protein